MYCELREQSTKIMHTHNTHTHVTSHRHSMYDKYVEKEKKVVCFFLLRFYVFLQRNTLFSCYYFIRVVVVLLSLYYFHSHFFSLSSFFVVLEHNGNKKTELFSLPRALNKTFSSLVSVCFCLYIMLWIRSVIPWRASWNSHKTLQLRVTIEGVPVQPWVVGIFWILSRAYSPQYILCDQLTSSFHLHWYYT